MGQVQILAERRVEEAGWEETFDQLQQIESAEISKARVESVQYQKSEMPKQDLSLIRRIL